MIIRLGGLFMYLVTDSDVLCGYDGGKCEDLDGKKPMRQ